MGRFTSVLSIGLIAFGISTSAEARRIKLPPAPSPTPTPTASITVLPSTPSSPSAISGTSFQLTFNFSGGPTSVPMTVFVHFVDSAGAIVFGADHVPPTQTTGWTGSISYPRSVFVPNTVASGTYRILVGLVNPTTGARLALVPGSGVSDAGTLRYQIGNASVQGASATPSPTPAPTPAPTATPAPTPAPTATPPPTTGTIPAGYTARAASTYGVRCDGVTDDTAAIQRAFDSLTGFVALQFPAGTCVTSNIVRIHTKANVVIMGAGASSTIFKATNPSYSSFVIYTGTNVTFQDFQIYGPNTSIRMSDANSRGVYVERSSGIKILRVKVNNVSGAGIVFFVVRDSSILNSEVLNSWADAFHITGGSQNILVQNSTTTGAGDDCFASIGYGTDYNYNIQFLDNSCYGNTGIGKGTTRGGSGVSFEGTTGGKAYRNYFESTGVAGIRVATPGSYQTGLVSQIDIQYNTLVKVRVHQDIPHGAVMIYTDWAAIDSVNIANNKIIDPQTGTAMQLLSYGPLINNVSLVNNAITDTLGRVTNCVTTSGNVTNTTRTGNTKNGVACN